MTASAGTLLAGRRVIVTGGANGIGAVVAHRFAAMGARGGVLDLPAALSGERPAVPVDVREEDSVRTALAESARMLDGIDAVVAAAGVVPSWQRPADMDLADFDRVLSIDACGVACTIEHAARLLGADSRRHFVAPPGPRDGWSRPAKSPHSWPFSRRADALVSRGPHWTSTVFRTSDDH